MTKKHKTWKRSRSKSGKMTKGKLILTVCLVAAVLTGVGVWQFASGEKASPINVDPTSIAPDFSLRDITGVGFSLSQYRGKVILVHFMALAGCTGQLDNINYVRLPQLGSVYSKYSSDQVVLITISVATCQGCDTILAKLRQENGISWCLGNDYDDGKLDIVEAYSRFSIGDGTIVVVDKSFNVAQVISGGSTLTVNALTSKIDQLL